MSYDDNIEQGMNRRGFLKAAALTAVAATATGTGAAFLLEKGGTPTITSVQAPVLPPDTYQTTVQTGQDVSDIMARLASAQAENMRLSSELSAAQRQLAATQNTVGVDPAAQASQIQLEEANAQIGALSGQVGVLGGLVALYEQLEGVDLGTVANNGIASVSGALDELFQNVPSVEEGLLAGQQGGRLIRAAKRQFHHLVKIAVEHLAEPANVEGVAAHQALHGGGVESVDQQLDILFIFAIVPEP
jgi:hypothetical protein